MSNLNIKCIIKASVSANVTDIEALNVVVNVERLEREAEAEIIDRVKLVLGVDAVEVEDMEVYLD